MDIFVCRHGEAGWNAAVDAERPLTDKGHGDTQALGREVIQARAPLIQRLWASPYLRTQQSADNILSQAGFTHVDEIKQSTDLLTPSSNPQTFLDDLYQQTQGCPKDAVFIVVTHMPFISSLLSLMVEGSSMQARGFPMYPGSCAHLRAELVAAGLFKLEQVYHPA